MIVRVTARDSSGAAYPALINTDFLEFADPVAAAGEYRQLNFESGKTLVVFETIAELETLFKSEAK